MTNLFSYLWRLEVDFVHKMSAVPAIVADNSGAGRKPVVVEIQYDFDVKALSVELLFDDPWSLLFFSKSYVRIVPKTFFSNCYSIFHICWFILSVITLFEKRYQIRFY